MQKALVLGAIIKRIGNFDLSEFEGRLVLQKTIYLLQNFGIYLDYKFSWYVHGPYCPELTRDAFKLVPIYDNIPELKFENNEIERLIQQYNELLGERKNDSDWLEQLACTHFLSILYPRTSKEAIIDIVLNHESHFTRNQCEQAWNYLIKNGLINNRVE